MSLAKGCLRVAARAPARAFRQSRLQQTTATSDPAVASRIANSRFAYFGFSLFSQVPKRMYGAAAHHDDEDDDDDHHHEDHDAVVIPPGALTFTREEVGRHNALTDCWIIINNRVYNVTTWLDLHPGGRDPIMEHAGKEASAAFAEVGHSHIARAAMKEFHIGYVASKRRYDGMPTPTDV